MRRFGLFFHFMFSVGVIVALASYWCGLLFWGRGGGVRLGPIFYTDEQLLLVTFVLAPAAFFCGCRAVQGTLPNMGLLGGWSSLRPLSNAFASVGVLLISFILVFDTPWAGIRSTDWVNVFRAAGAPAELVFTDESLDYPALPLAPPDNYAWSVYDLDGSEVPMTRFKGKAIVVNEWATWCPPCRAEMPSLNQLYEELRDKNIAFVFVSKEEPTTVRQFIANNKYSIPVYVRKDELPLAFRSDGIPATFVLAPNGSMAFMHVGGAKWDTDKTKQFLVELASSDP